MYRMWLWSINVRDLVVYARVCACVCACTRTANFAFVAVIVADDCASNPCLNDAVCQDGLGMFTCSCSSGYEGKQCETG